MRTNQEPNAAEARHADPDDQFAPPPLVLLVVRLLLMVFGDIEAAIAWIESHTGLKFARPSLLSTHYHPRIVTDTSLDALFGNYGVFPTHPPVPQPIRLWEAFDPNRLPSRGPRLGRRPAALIPSVTTTSAPAASLATRRGRDPPRRLLNPYAHNPGTAPCGPAIGVGRTPSSHAASA